MQDQLKTMVNQVKLNQPIIIQQQYQSIELPLPPMPQEEHQNQLWIDKYAPTCIAELVGNKKEIESFYDWLKDWEEVHLRGNKKEIYTKASNKFQDMPKINAKACIISGPPGIGKSSTVKIVSQELGYNLIELNASDTRSKKMIDNLLKDLSSSSSIKKY